MAATEFGAEVEGKERDEEGVFTEKGLQAGEAAADDCEVDFDCSVVVIEFWAL